jgi:UDP-glucose 4-epimerase
MNKSDDGSSPPVEYIPQRVLVTGASGFIGRHLVDLLRSDGTPVRTLGRRPPSNIPTVLQDHVVEDVRHDFVGAADGCDAIVHLAGLSDASASFENPIDFTETNLIGTIRALEAARRVNAAIIIASSQRVYRPAIRPLGEEAPLGPVDPYGETKLQAEEWTELYVRLYGLRATILRFFSIYGPGQVSGRASGVVSIFLKTAREGRPIRARARQLRDFVDVRDAVRAIGLALRRPPEALRVCNVGTGQATSIAELGELVRSVVGHPVPVIVDLSPGAESYVADPRRAASELGFRSEIDLLDGLNWYNCHFVDAPAGNA